MYLDFTAVFITVTSVTPFFIRKVCDVVLALSQVLCPSLLGRNIEFSTILCYNSGENGHPVGISTWMEGLSARCDTEPSLCDMTT